MAELVQAKKNFRLIVVIATDNKVFWIELNKKEYLGIRRELGGIILPAGFLCRLVQPEPVTEWVSAHTWHPWICLTSFLQCQPAVWDAKHLSAQKRSRFFWGNIPGLYRYVEGQTGHLVSFHLKFINGPLTRNESIFVCLHVILFSSGVFVCLFVLFVCCYCFLGYTVVSVWQGMLKSWLQL